jgi:anoctamin-7
MVLQFGFVTIFVSSFPLAPFFAIINNLVEIRLDARKITRSTRRIVAERAKDIGIWFSILSAVTKIAVITNACLISFSSDFINRAYYMLNKDTIKESYIDWVFATWSSPDEPKCYYEGFKDTEGNYTLMHWKLLSIRLAFVIVFEHFVFGIGRLIDVVVPDIPRALQLKIKREQYLAKQTISFSLEQMNLFPQT